MIGDGLYFCAEYYAIEFRMCLFIRKKILKNRYVIFRVITPFMLSVVLSFTPEEGMYRFVLDDQFLISP